MSEASDMCTGKLIFVTGGTGFVGTHTTRLLHDLGYTVRCLVRSTSNLSNLPPDVELVEGSLLNREALAKGVKDCWGVIHIGGAIRVKRKADFLKINCEGTKLLVNAAHEAKVDRFILTSSQAAAGPSINGRRRTSQDFPEPITVYGRSKLAGENALRLNAGDMWWSIIRPPAVYGSFDYSFLPLIKSIKHGFRLSIGKPIIYSAIHAADLAKTLSLCLTLKSPSGHTWYATDGVDHSGEEFNQSISDILGVKTIRIAIPKPVAYAVATAIETWGNITNQTVLLNRDKIKEITTPFYTCNDSDFRELSGFKSEYDLHRGMNETINWYRKQGLI